MKLSCALALAGASLAAAAPCAAQARQSSDAVVLVRVFASVTAEIDGTWKKIQRANLEVATASGFIVSTSGYVLTNHHVVELEDATVEVNGLDVSVRRTLERIEVMLPSGQRLDASVVAADPEMDLAVLAIPGGGLPYLPLGDSDASERGTLVAAIGYPFGRSIEIGRQRPDDVVPQATVTAGAISAIRGGDDEQPRYFQVTNPLNPGNSGGPLVDEEGYALGVVVMKATKADSIGFAIAINRAKDFLERTGLDSALPSRRLGLAAPSSLREKGIRLQMPHGYQDRTPARLRVVASDGTEHELALRIRRVASHLTVDRIEQELLAGRLFGRGSFELDPKARRAARGTVAGRAFGTDSGGERWTMEYRIVPAGGEWVIAQYTAPADHIAFNRSVLRASLGSLEADRLLSGEPRPPRWLAGNPLPEGWLLDADDGQACPPGVVSPTVFVVSAPENFTVSARYAMWDGPSAEAILAGCKLPADGSYKRLSEIAGVRYVSLGQLLPLDRGALEITLTGPQQREPSLTQWLREWRAALEGK